MGKYFGTDGFRGEANVGLTADHAIDRIRTRFGREAIGYGPVALDKREGVPDAFRSLAEKEL